MSPSVRVILADDAHDIRLLLRYVLDRDGGFEIVGEAADGRQAVDLAAADCPDLVLLDLAMPVMDGLEAIPEIRRLCPHAKIAILTAFRPESVAREVRDSGADAFLEKTGRLVHDLPGRLHELAGAQR